MSKRNKHKQEDLFPFHNPLKEKFDTDFFRQIPKEPGVYIMKGKNGEILYVGKSKNLQQRLRSYRYVKPGNVSKKVLKIITKVKDITWEKSDSEEAALLHENKLLRKHRPEFNQVNTQPETYFFITLTMKDESLLFNLTMDPSDINHDFLYGSFKGFNRVYRGYGSLIRLLWAVRHIDDDLMQIPMKLMHRKPPEKYSFHFDNDFSGEQRKRYVYLIKRYLKGTSRLLINKLKKNIYQGLDTDNHFIKKLIELDLNELDEFYENCSHKNYKIYRQFDLNSPVIAQDRLDDLVVSYRHSKN